MRLIYASGFSAAEKGEWRAIIFANILSAFKVILDAMEDMGFEFDNKANEVSISPLHVESFAAFIQPIVSLFWIFFLLTCETSTATHCSYPC